MIVLMSVAVAAVAVRIATRRFTAPEWVLLAIAALNYLTLAGQLLGCYGPKRYEGPEMRYWIQSGVLFLGWTAWGLSEAARAAARRWRPAGLLLPLVVAAFAAVDVAMLVKPHVPGSRRNANVRACEWAEGLIRADWKGPSADGANAYSDSGYHVPGRPAVFAHTGLLAYRLGGRQAAPNKFGAVDAPDYVVGEESKVRSPQCAEYSISDYALLGSAEFGRRRYQVYRRLPGRPEGGSK